MRFGWLAAVTAVLSSILIPVAPASARATAAPTIAERQDWYFDLLRVGQAQRISTGAGVVVAVVDSGVDASHPDLRGRVLPGAGVGGEAPDGRSDRADGHGTNMAGIIAGGGGGDPDRVTGIAPDARILPYAQGGDSTTSSGAAGIRWAADHGAAVINLSWGVDAAPSPELTAAVAYALSRDVVLVAAAGNLSAGDRGVVSPARIPGVIAVTGLGTDGEFWSGGSVRGPGAVLAAPAEDIVSAAPVALTGSGYTNGRGTSNAAAIVAGVAALVRSRYPELDAANVVNRLVRTAADRGTPGWDEEYGAGVVDPVAALTGYVPGVDRNPLLVAAPAGPGAAGVSVAVVALLLTAGAVAASESARRRAHPGRPKEGTIPALGAELMGVDGWPGGTAGPHAGRGCPAAR